MPLWLKLGLLKWLFSAKIILTCLLVSVLFRLPANADDQMVYVVALTAHTEKDAIKAAEKLIGAGYQGEVYLAPVNKYIVTAGKISQKQAQKLKEKAQKEGILPKYAYLSTGSEFQKRIFPVEAEIPAAPPDSAASPKEEPAKSEAAPQTQGVKDESPKASPAGAASKPPAKAVEFKVISGGVFIIAGSTQSMDDAIRQADEIFAKGFQGEVYWTSDEKYVVAIGPYAQSKIEEVRSKALQSGLITGDARTSKGKEYLEKIYSTEGQKRFSGSDLFEPSSKSSTPPDTSRPAETKNGGEPAAKTQPPAEAGNYFVIVKLTRSEDEATTIAKDLEKKGYEVKVYWTSGEEYAVTIGYFPREQAELTRKNAIQYGDATDDATLSTGREFLRRVYPPS